MGTMVFPSVKARTRHLRPGEELLNDHPAAGPAKGLVLHHGANGVLRLLPGSWQMSTPLPRARPSALTTMGIGAVSDIGQGLVAGRQRLHSAAVGMPYFFIRPLANTLLPSMMAALACPGQRQGCPSPRSRSTNPRHQGIVRSHHHKVHAFPSHSKSVMRLNVRGPDGQAGGVMAAMPPLPGSGVKRIVMSGIFLQLFGQWRVPGRRRLQSGPSCVFLQCYPRSLAYETINGGTGACR